MAKPGQGAGAAIWTEGVACIEFQVWSDSWTRDAEWGLDGGRCRAAKDTGNWGLPTSELS